MLIDITTGLHTKNKRSKQSFNIHLQLADSITQHATSTSNDGSNLNFLASTVTRIKDIAKLFVFLDVKVMNLYELRLFHKKTTSEIAFESRFFRSPDEETIGKGKVKRGDKETYGLHNVPT